MSQPAPPPEAVLIRLVREAGNIKLPAAAKAAGISVARWSQIENGYEMRLGEARPVQGTRSTIAHMAAAIGLEPARLATEGARPDAAAVLAEILRSDGGPPDPQDLSDAELQGELDDLTRRIEELRSQNRLRLGGKANGDTKQQRRRA
jgi:transcriptional regulator with XRE-family HTH domain